MVRPRERRVRDGLHYKNDFLVLGRKITNPPGGNPPEIRWNSDGFSVDFQRGINDFPTLVYLHEFPLCSEDIRTY